MATASVRDIVEGFARDLQGVLTAVREKGWTDEQREELEQHVEGLLQSGEEVLHEMRTERGWRWEKARYEDIMYLKRDNRQGQPAIARASVIQCNDVEYDNDGARDFISAILRDTESGEQIPTASITEPNLTKLQRLSRSQAALDFLGFSIQAPILRPRKRWVTGYVFVVIDIRAATDPLQIVMASPGEVHATRQHLKYLCSRATPPAQWIRDEVADIVGIRGLRANPLLRELVEVMVLQALSDNHVANANGRIHTLFIGPPSSGKKLLVMVAAIANIRYRQAGHKITAAGLVGATKMKEGTFSSEPGLMPLADRGTLALEDFHAVPRSRLNEIVGHLSQCMEDGEVYDSTAAKTKFKANTAIHLDCNRLSDLFPGSRATTQDFASLPMNILSRFDCVYDLQRDATRQLEMAQAMILETDEVGPSTRVEQTERVRKVQLVVAMIRADIPKVEAPAAIREYACNLTTDMWGEFSEHPLLLDFLSMFMTRMVNSMWKLAAAHARGHLRCVMQKEDIDMALAFIRRKLDFLRNFAPATDFSSLNSGERRERTARSGFGSDPFTAREYAEATDASNATAYRDLKDLRERGIVRRVKGGKYTFENAERESNV